MRISFIVELAALLFAGAGAAWMLLPPRRRAIRPSVPDDLTSCHTGVVDRYVVEGHVPLRDIKRLLAEKLAGCGLSVPGMPVGSPRMEVAGEPAEAYTVWLFKGAKRSVLAQYAGAAMNK